MHIIMQPRSQGPRNAICLVSFFSRDHDLVEIEPEFLEQKDNILHVIQPTLHPTLGVYDIRPPIARYM